VNTTTQTNVITEALAIFERDPELILATAQVSDVSGQLDGVEREINTANTAAAQRPSDGLTERATALLDGHDRAVPREFLHAELLGHIGLLNDRRRVLIEAKRLAIARRGAVHQKLGAQVRTVLLPSYRAICAELGEALEAVAEINAELGAILEALSRHDIPHGELRPMAFTAIGQRTDQHSGVNRWHREASEFGIIEDSR
jgi:hypothetical protein